MSRPRYWWYGNVKKAIMCSPKFKAKTQSGYKRLETAIAKALDDASKMSNGEMRLIAIDRILLSKTHTAQGVALEIHFSDSTVNVWIREFVNSVGAYMGYDGEE